MKRIGVNALLGLILLGGIACTATKDIEIAAIEPAAIDLEQHISRIGIVNTSSPGDNEPIKDALERRFARETFKLSAEGQEAAISGLHEALRQDGRFDTILFIEETPEALLGLDTAPKQDAWESIQHICDTYSLDAVFALASYDTETHVKIRKKSYLALDLIRVKNKVKGHEITVETLIENGWRIYEPKTQVVLDEFVFKGAIVSKGQGQTPTRALENLGSRYDDFVTQSHKDGSKYGARLRPMERKLVRQLYIKGSVHLEEAYPYTQTENWEDAVRLWQKDISGSKTKPKSRAYHNLAVWQENQGQINTAMLWAQKADATHSTKSSKAYLATLEARQKSEIVVQQQLTHSNFID